ncbi:MAG TPA: holo-ACP synthase [Candidatus Limnocylindria bacterium]|nr:holo-ACP synthase [Candidatus Limnocylindria bacterium]
MIVGLGLDACEISRMADLLKGGAFLRRYFDAGEQEYILARGAFAAASMAGCYAAKEAFAKALGRGFDGIRPEDIAVRHRESGMPYYDPQRTALAAMRGAGAARALLSVTHEAGVAMAVCVLEGE